MVSLLSLDEDSISLVTSTSSEDHQRSLCQGRLHERLFDGQLLSRDCQLSLHLLDLSPPRDLSLVGIPERLDSIEDCRLVHEVS